MKLLIMGYLSIVVSMLFLFSYFDTVDLRHWIILYFGIAK